jgi:hypothetical protein
MLGSLLGGYIFEQRAAKGKYRSSYSFCSERKRELWL